MWIIALVILFFCFHEVFGKPILWLALGGIAGYFIGKHKVPEQLKQKYEEFKQLIKVLMQPIIKDLHRK
jgi:hypothetical protein